MTEYTITLKLITDRHPGELIEDYLIENLWDDEVITMYDFDPKPATEY